MNQDSKIYIAGHTGLVGSALVRKLKGKYANLILISSKELDLRDQKKTQEFFLKEKPDYLFLAAAKVGGIKANKEKKAEFIYDNIQIQSNVIHSAWNSGVKKLLFFASNCMYPRDSKQPIKEEYFFTGAPEITNDAFAAAKIAGVKMCQAYREQYGANFISVVPASLFGPNDNFDLENSHFVPALIRKFHEAKSKGEKTLSLWGTGTPKREILYVDDLADAAVFLMGDYNSPELINIGFGQDFSIKEISEIVRKIIGFEGNIVFDAKYPDGTMRKLLDSGKINSLGWKPKTSLEQGLRKTYEWFLSNYK